MAFMTKDNLDWNVVSAPLTYTLPNGETRELGNRVVNLRDDNYAQLGIVSPSYEVYQNSSLKNLVAPMLSEGLITVENQGYLGKGGRVFIQARMAEEFRIVGEDHVGMLTLMNSHDGGSNLSAGVTDTRIVCSNTFAQAMTDMSSKIKHDFRMAERALEITETINFVNEGMRKFSEAAEVLATTKASESVVDQVIRAAYGKKENETVRSRDRIQHLFRYGKGNEGKTLWDAFNAITEFVTHEGRKDQRAKFAYSNFGTGAALSRRAMDAALALV